MSQCVYFIPGSKLVVYKTWMADANSIYWTDLVQIRKTVEMDAQEGIFNNTDE